MANTLKKAILDAGIAQYEVARKTNIMSETRLSRLVRGRAVATEEEQKALALVLGKSRVDLFGGGV